MKKFSSKSSDKVLITYVLKACIAAIVSVAVFSLAFSYIIYKFDLSLDFVKISSIFICALSAFITALISVSGFKNNGVLIGIIAQFPLILYSLFNLIFNENSILFFALKAVIILLTGALTGVLVTKRNKKIKV